MVYGRDGELFDAFGEEGELTESIDTVLYARYETVFYVYYMDEKHEKVIFAQELTGMRMERRLW